MRKLYLLTFFLVISVQIFAQIPQKINYQAVLRDNNGTPLANESVELGISILQGSASGTEVCYESFTVTTNSFGLVNIQIGSINTIDFSSIDWANGPFYIKIKVGNIEYGTSQILSVPYALHAKTAENLTGTIEETDPYFNAWDKNSGITISENQILDLQTYLTSESDPIFSAWDKSSGIIINENQISDLQSYLISESDPAFSSWDKSTGISITESQISDLQTYLTSESDPNFNSWDKSSGITINESQISDLQSYLTSESDPVFSSWDKSTGISITESQISDLQTYLTSEFDPIFTTWDKSSGIIINESQISDLQSYLISESDPVFSSWDKNYNDLINTPIIIDSINTVLDTTTQFIRTEIDGDVTNEIQTISRAGLNVTLSNGGGTFVDSVLSETDVDNFVANNGYATKNMNNENITNLARPINDQDAVTKEYVDSIVNRIDMVLTLLKNTGTSASDMLDAGFTMQELLDKGYTVMDLLNAGESSF